MRDWKGIFFLFYFPTAPSKEILVYHYSLPDNSLHFYIAPVSLLSAFRYSLKVHIAEGGQWEDQSPLDMAPGRGVSYLLPLKVFFYAMPFPARQQGGLTGDYVSLPGYTETKQRVRQDHPLLLPSHPQLPLFPQLIPLPSAFDTLKIPKFHCCVQKFWPLFLNFVSIDSARVPLAPLILFSFLCFFYTFHCPTQPFPSYFTSFFLQLKNFNVLIKKKKY